MKYEFTGEEKVLNGRNLKQIRALVTIVGVVSSGDCGGWIEHERNLDQFSGNAWVYGDAQVYGNAWVYGNARVSVSPVVISGMKYPITVSDNTLAAGCQNWKFEEWRAKTSDEILQMDGESAAVFYPKLIAILDLLGK